MGDNDLALLEAAARAAGEIATAHFERGVKAWEKSDGQGLLTEADLAVNAHLEQMLTGARPDYGWLSEESDPLGDLTRLARQRVFVIDPIDGTRAFAGGQKGFAHALAVVENGRPEAAVVHLPLMGLTYSARRGRGAFLNGARLMASPRSALPGARVLANRALLQQENWQAPVPAFQTHFRSSLAWRLALVGEGAFDAAVVLRDGWDWDIAAASLIAEEAGARVSDLAGAQLRFNSPQAHSKGVVAAGPQLYDALQGALRAPHPDSASKPIS